MNDIDTINKLKELIVELKKRVEFLERENNRRKSEISQLSAVIRRG